MPSARWHEFTSVGVHSISPSESRKSRLGEAPLRIRWWIPFKFAIFAAWNRRFGIAAWTRPRMTRPAFRASIHRNRFEFQILRNRSSARYSIGRPYLPIDPFVEPCKTFADTLRDRRSRLLDVRNSPEARDARRTRWIRTRGGASPIAPRSRSDKGDHPPAVRRVPAGAGPVSNTRNGRARFAPSRASRSRSSHGSSAAKHERRSRVRPLIRRSYHFSTRQERGVSFQSLLAGKNTFNLYWTPIDCATP